MGEISWDGGDVRMPFGRYKGMIVRDLPSAYLEYHVGPNPDKTKKQIKQPLYREAFLGELERRKLRAQLMAKIEEFINSLTEEEQQELVKEAIRAIPNESTSQVIAEALDNTQKEELRDKLNDLLEEEEDNAEDFEDDDEE